jgi:3',5'-cyclic AMP phosphodiesterase CpdA
LAHFSDLHVTTRTLGWQPRDWLSKRVAGWVNARWLRRRHDFAQADEVVRALVRDLDQRAPDRVVFSGDATTLGFEAELAHAAALLGVTNPARFPGLAVPGNHDYYTAAQAASGQFEHHFAPWQVGHHIDLATYPFAQRVGPLWLVGVNSCTGNFWPWDSRGAVAVDQLDRLERLLQQLEPGLKILVTHYPVCLASGQMERPGRGLRNLHQVVAVAARGGVCLWLHGHRHGAYSVTCSQLAPFPVVCAGSATEKGRWSYGEYVITGWQFHATRRVFNPTTHQFDEGASFDLELAGPTTAVAPNRVDHDLTNPSAMPGSS